MNEIEYDHDYSYDEIVFGIPLEVMMDRPNQRVAPSFLKHLIKYLNLKGLKHPNLFRNEVDMEVVAELKHRFNSGELVEPPDPDVAAFLLRLWLLELPEPLYPYELYDSFLEVATLSGRQTVIKLKELVSRMPEPNRGCSQLLIMFLSRVVEYFDHNQMNATDLSVIFGSTLFRPPDLMAFSAGFLLNAPKASFVIQCLIEGFDVIYGLQVDAANIHKSGSFLNAISRSGSISLTSSPLSQRKERSDSIDSALVSRLLLAEKEEKYSNSVPSAPSSPLIKASIDATLRPKHRASAPESNKVQEIKPEDKNQIQGPDLSAIKTPTNPEELFALKLSTDEMLDYVTCRIESLKAKNIDLDNYDQSSKHAIKVAKIKWFLENLLGS